MRKFITAGLLVAVVPFAAACGQAEKQDAHTSHDVDRTPGHVTAMPDNFANVVDKCAEHTGYRVFVTSHADEKAPAMQVVSDPKCR